MIFEFLDKDKSGDIDVDEAKEVFGKKGENFICAFDKIAKKKDNNELDGAVDFFELCYGFSEMKQELSQKEFET